MIIHDVQELVRIAVVMGNVTVHYMSVHATVDGLGMDVRSLIVLEILTAWTEVGRQLAIITNTCSYDVKTTKRYSSSGCFDCSLIANK